MGGPHPDVEALYEGIRDDEAVPWTYVVFHELNGRGVDGLATDETFDRMRHYQPGVSGTPDLEVDGGWHELGGMYPNTDSITESNVNNAIGDADQRYERQFDPWNPRDFIRNDFKFVNLDVEQYYQEGEWAVVVTVEYLGMDRVLIEDDLQGSLYVFMVEDDVTAYSVVDEEMVLNHNVFRGYALEDQSFTMSPGDIEVFAGVWQIPEIIVDPNEEYPDGEPVPVKPMDITAVAAIFDTGDTSSANGASGNPNAVPRCIESATPQSTAYERQNEAEAVGGVAITEDGGTIFFEASITDPDGAASAALFWTVEGPDSPNWSAAVMSLAGEELCDDTGACYAYADATASVSIEAGGADQVWYIVGYTDGNGAMGESETLTHEVGAVAAGGGGVGVALTWAIAAAIVVVLLLLAYLAFKAREPSTRRAIVAVALLVVLVSSALFVSGIGGSGDRAPNVEFTDVDGNDLEIKDFRGKVVVLDLMATWCPTCKIEMSHLLEVHERYGDSIEMITVDIDQKETEDQLKAFMDEYGAEWRATMDNEDQDFYEKYKSSYIPKMVVIDIKGNVVLSKVGEVSADELSDAIDEASTGGSKLVSLGAGGTGAAGLLLWAVGMGAFTFFSPCSFPLLPGYMTYYLGLRDARNQRKSILAGLSAATGIVLLFLVIAILVGLFGTTISRWVIYLEPVVGVLLVIMAFILLTDRQLRMDFITFPVKKGLAFSRKVVGRFLKRGATDQDTGALVTTIEEGGYTGLFFYGLGYGAAAAGCMAPVVIGLILLAAAQGTFLGAVVIFMVFAAVMAVLMVVITMTVASYGGQLLDRLRFQAHTISRLSGALLFVVGVWILFYFVAGLA
jgi:cytochrome c-type biogenesis protein